MGFLAVTVIAIAVLRGVPAAHAQTFGEWLVDTKDQTTLSASSVNDSGHLLGQFRFPDEGACYWLIGIKTACQKGAKYPVLANSDAGAAARYRRIMPHRGHKKAVVAAAHALLTTAYHLLGRQTSYRDLGPDYYDRRHANASAIGPSTRSSVRGYRMILEPAA